MKEYIVNVREVHIQMVSVEAESPEEAILIVAGGGGEYLDDSLEYSHALDREYWTVDEMINLGAFQKAFGELPMKKASKATMELDEEALEQFQEEEELDANP